MIARRFQPQLKNLMQLITVLMLAALTPAAASAAVSLNLSQCGNLANGAPTDCGWQNGNLNSNQAHWLEGDSVPYQLVISGLTPNTSYTITIGYGTTKGGKHAIDYLTSFDRSMAGGTPAVAPTNGTANECSGVTGCTTPPNLFAIPQDPNVTAAGVTPISGNFAMFNGTITAAGGYSLTGSYTSDSQTNVTVTFTSGAANAGGKTNVVLAWAGHIATRANWGQGSGAVNITGSPFHTVLVSFSGGNVGSQDRGLTATAVIFPATITITKAAIPTGSTSFPFTISPVLPVGTSSVSAFSLVNDGSSSNTVTYTLNTSNAFNVPYAITESAVPGWSLIGLSCTEDSVSGSAATTSGSTATITPQEAGIISCTYTNSEPVVAPPSFSPSGGTYTRVQTITISTVTQGASIRYTTDGSTPNETAGILYTGPVTVNTSKTLKAIAFESGMIDSAVNSATYTVNLPAVATPTFSPAAGTYSTSQSVIVATTTQGASIRYTTDGSTPSETVGTLYTAAVVVNSTTALKAIAYETGMTDSAVASATYTLPITVSVAPSTATLYGSQTQQFSATVTNASNTAVTWTLSPSGPWSISSTGLYTAPSSITAQQTVTVVATSVADPTASASATVTLNPGSCTSSAYSYIRSIIIDHTKVPNIDQINFPFLFNATDPSLATTANGGHVANANGYDIVFSTDPAGQNLLNYEMEEYNPTTGNVVAWVNLPTLSHSADTVLYVLYGNSAITTSQQNASAVWSNGYAGVWHLASDPTASAPQELDSTSSGNNGTATTQGSAWTSAQLVSGVFGKALNFLKSQNQGVSMGYFSPITSSGNFTVSDWFKVSSYPSDNGYMIVKGADYPDSSAYGLGMSSGGQLYVLATAGGGVHTVAVSPSPVSKGAWHYAVGTRNGNIWTLYIDGVAVNSSTQSVSINANSGTKFDMGITDRGSPYQYAFDGDLQEGTISNVARSADWIAASYNNQSSPSTFYRLLAENTIGVTPSIAAAYSSQNLQLTAIPVGSCTSAISWAVSPSESGAINSAGLYTAPANIGAQQTVTITATPTTGTMNSGTATVLLLPENAPLVLTLNALAPSPYTAGTSQTFVAKLTDPAGTPLAKVPVTLSLSGANPGVMQVLTDANGSATYTVTGINTGIDTMQASATLNGVTNSSNAVSVMWVVTQNPNGQYSLALNPSGNVPTLDLGGLCGAFTDASGSVVQALDIGASAKVFVVPAGASQLQLGINDDYYSDNYGPGFNVDINGVPVLVPANAMPWLWTAGGLNSSYPFGVHNGGNPIVAATNLAPGQIIAVKYQGGTISPGGPYGQYDANGVPGLLTGATLGSTGSYSPTKYMYGETRTIGQTFVFTAALKDGAGSAVSNTAVQFNIVGANSQQLSGTTDAGGNATVSYQGQNAGTDSVQAVATISGNSVQSGTTTIVWLPSVSSSSGTLQLTPADVPASAVGGQVSFTVVARNSSGNPVPGIAVDLALSGADNVQLHAMTDASGAATFTYQNAHAGTTSGLCVAFIDGNVTYSNEVDMVWNQNGGGTTGSTGPITIQIQSDGSVTLPSDLQLNATITDINSPPSPMPSVTWSQVAGPGTTTFGNNAIANTTASFSVPGSYVLQLAATDGTNSAAAQTTVSVNSTSGTQGWLGSPSYGATVTGIVPVTVAAGTTLVTGRLIYYSANDPYAVSAVLLNPNTTGSGQIGTFDTTSLPNGSYYLQLQATDSSGNSQYSIALVTVAGQYKPGRVTSTVTDLVVPATGLAIRIQRQYDSLNAESSRDFGYGWSLGTNVDLSVDAAYNVSLTVGGQRKTFYFTPQFFFFLGHVAAYTPEPGLAGSLIPIVDFSSCPFEYLIPDGALWQCAGGGLYNPVGYVYTDASGTQYTISASGGLQSVRDIGGNTLTVTPNGITSSTGLSVTFLRDTAGRITRIVVPPDATDPEGKTYLYGYSEGNLTSVTYPGVTQPSTYTYTPDHLYLSGTDFRNNPLPSTSYFGATDTDVNGLPLNGRLHTVTDALGETTTYAYNLSTNTTTITYPPDANGNVGTATMVYDSYGMLVSSTDPLGHTTANKYYPDHKLMSVTDPLNHTTSYTYDTLGNRTSTTYPKTGLSTNTTSTVAYNQYSEPTSSADELGNVRTYTYDANNWPVAVTDTINGVSATLMSSQFNANGTINAGAIGYDIASQPTKASQFTYDTYGNLATKTDALGRVTSYTYDTLGRKTSMVEPYPSGGNAADATTTYEYDDLGNLTKTTAPLGRITSAGYDGNGNKTSDTDPLQHTTTYDHDALNRLTTTTYPTEPATTSSNTYDFRGNIITQTDQAGHVTKNQYDLAGRLTSVTKAFGTSDATTTTYTYYDDGRKHTETDTLNHTTTYTYDEAGRLTGVSGVAGSFTYAYDDAGNRISSTDGKGHTTQYQYDSRKRLVQTTYPDADHTFVKNGYDGPGNLTSVTDQANNVVNYTYDAANQLQTVVQTNSPNTGQNTTTYGYDLLSNLASSSDANTHITLNSYNLLSQMTDRTLPDGSLKESRTYDLSGNLKTVTHFDDKVTTYTYDNLNRLLTRAPDSSLGEPTVSFTYTATGKRHTMTDGSGTTTYGYDSADRLSSKATPAGTLSYTYDSAGHVASISSSNVNGASMSYTYDPLGRLSTVVDNRLPAGHNTTTYTYDDAYNVATVTDPNSLITAYTYDQLNRVTGTSTSSISSYTYQLGPTGNRTSATEQSGRTMTWSYDGIYRLTSESISSDPNNTNGTVTYGLDPVGNRQTATSTISGLAPISGTFNQDDQLAGETYDSNGNTINTGGKSFAYDSENRLTSMNNGAVTIVYDGDGNRLSKTAAGATTRYLVDDLNPTGYPQVIEEVVGGAVQREYTYGLQRISQNQVISGTWTASFYGYDGMGTVRQLTNLSGTVTDTYNYDAIGNEIGSTGTTPNVYLYRGEQYDSDLGLYYLRARYYNPATGRFLSRDPEDGKPIDPKTLHKYLYAGGDPINALDPTGMATLTKPQGGLGGAVGEFLATVTDISFQIGFYTQFAIPAYLASPQGKLLIVKALGLLAAGAVITCEYEEFAHELDPSKQEPINCGYFDTPDVQ